LKRRFSFVTPLWCAKNPERPRAPKRLAWHPSGKMLPESAPPAGPALAYPNPPWTMARNEPAPSAKSAWGFECPA